MNTKLQIVVGGGVAGIAFVAALIDHNYQNIIWIDRHFKGGDFHNYYGIPSNVPMQLVMSYI
jgi:cation diffusion facilitator CzcD-associated flavoprotein CzcO